MFNSNLRDSYTIVKLNNPDLFIPKDKIVTFTDGFAWVEDLECPLGEISHYVEDVLYVSPFLYQLRKDNIVPVNTDEPLVFHERELNEFNITSGVVLATYDGYVIIYLGVVELDEDVTTINSLDYYDLLVDEAEEELYTITDLGKELLKSLDVDDIVKEITDMRSIEERKEKISMNNLFGNSAFGKVHDSRFKISMNGIAVSQKDGKYIVYNKDSNEFVDVSNLIFDIKDALFALPATEVSVGDTVLHEDKPYYIVDTTNEIKAVSYEDCTQTVLIPKSTMFGIKYFTKIFSLFGDNFASSGDLFNNPMVLMSLIDGKDSDLSQLMLMNSLGNGDLGSNPMALAMMLKGDKANDSLSTIALMSMFNNGNNPFAPKKKIAKESTTEGKN